MTRLTVWLALLATAATDSIVELRVPRTGRAVVLTRDVDETAAASELNKEAKR